ncbi:hypothetical protein FLX56_20960 [Synechococcus moorigangaii CMS01]|nr:hypothetical protein [Synechococcus moorigangaii CMS01]
MFLKKASLTVLSSLLLLAGASIPAKAQVYVNGEYIQGEELLLLEYLAGGSIPAGSYWLDYYTGEWGYAGDPTVQGIIGASSSYDNGYYGGNGNASSDYYYSTGGAGGYGSYVSDGDCAYFSSGDISVSTC